MMNTADCIRTGSFAAALTLSLLLSGAAIPTAQTSTPALPIFKLDAHSSAPMVHGKYPPEMVAKGQHGFDGAYDERTAFQTTDKQYSVRLWESAPGVLQTDGYPFDEYCLVLEGQLEITNPSGQRESFGPGDSFVIPKGWRGTWNMKTHFKKQYIDLIPASAMPASE